MELQKGKFSLEIEGDMFKAQVRFPAAEETPQTEGAKAPKESAGIPEEILMEYAETSIRIPMLEAARSL